TKDERPRRESKQLLRLVPPLSNELNRLDVADLALRNEKLAESAFYDGLCRFKLMAVPVKLAGRAGRVRHLKLPAIEAR
ncbi:MAG: hypothetical protein ACK5UT_21015, partial [Acidobacteriota bacterium]